MPAPTTAGTFNTVNNQASVTMGLAVNFAAK